MHTCTEQDTTLFSVDSFVDWDKHQCLDFGTEIEFMNADNQRENKNLVIEFTKCNEQTGVECL